MLSSTRTSSAFKIFIAILCTIEVAAQKVHFMGHHFDSHVWSSLQTDFNDFFTNGKWVSSWDRSDFEPLYSRPCSGSYGYVSRMCFDSNENQGRRLRWKPNKRDALETWSPEKMCQIMNGRNIAFVGDSLSEEMYLTVISAMWANVLVKADTPYDHDIIEKKRKQLHDRCAGFCPEMAPACEDIVPVDCGEHLPSFNLTLIRIYYLNITEDYLGKPWVQYIAPRNISLMIVNMGAHFVPIDQMAVQIDGCFKYMKEHHPKISVMYRDTSVGHVDCGKMFTSPPLMVAQDRFMLIKHHANYHWDSFTDGNMKVQEIIKANYSHIMYVNVYNASVTRVDSHPSLNGDCLHYCLPGPIDTWWLFIYSFIVKTHELGHHEKHHYTSSLPHGLHNNTSHGHNNHSSQHIHHNNTHHKHQHSKVVYYDKYIRIPTVQSRFTSAAAVAEGKDITVKVNKRTAIYLVRNGTRHIIPDGETFEALSLDWKGVKTISEGELYDIPIGRPIDSTKG